MGAKVGLATVSGLAILALAWACGSHAADTGWLEVESTHIWTKVPLGMPLEMNFHLRNLTDRPVVVQRGVAWGYVLRVELFDPSGQPVRWRSCGYDHSPPSPEVADFETLLPGGWSRQLGRSPRIPVPQVRGPHVLRYWYARPAPETPSLWARLSGSAEVDVATAERMSRAWLGTASGEIAFDVY
jgi:hypothetical protein